MIRSLASILAALNVAAPGFSHKEEAAAVLRNLGSENGHDPLTLVGIVENESGWQPLAYGVEESSAEEYVGLAQIRIRNFAVCKAGHEKYSEKLCIAVRHSLQDWRYNLTIASDYIRAARGYCSRTVGSGLAVHWLQAFQGFDAARGTTCGHVKKRGRWVAIEVPKLTRKVLARRRELAAL